MFVKGVNYNEYNKCMQVVSSASHTVNSASPLVKALNEKFGVESVTINTMYAQKRVNDEGLNYVSINQRLRWINKTENKLYVIG